MYVVKYGDSVLHDPTSSDRFIYGATVSQRTRSYSEFEFTMPPTHPLCSSIAIHDMPSPISVEFDGQLIFRGIVTSKRVNMVKELTVHCCSELVYLSWVCARYQQTHGGADFALAELLAIYNSYVNVNNRSVLGHEWDTIFFVDPQSNGSGVGFLDDDGNRVVSAQTESAASILSIIEDNILTPYGAVLRLRYGTDGKRYVGLFSSAPDTSDQEIRFGENLLDFEYEESDDGMFNAVFPIGGAVTRDEDHTLVQLYHAVPIQAGSSTVMMRADEAWTVIPDGILVYEIVDSEGNNYTASTVVMNERTEVAANESVNVSINPEIPVSIGMDAQIVWSYMANAPFLTDGTLTLRGWDYGDTPHVGGYFGDRDICYHEASASRYGIKCKVVSDSNVDTRWGLFNMSRAEIENNRSTLYTITINAVDMALYDDTKSHLVAGQKVRFVSEPHGFDTTLQVTECELDMDDPGNTKYTLGWVGGSLTSGVASIMGDLRNTQTNIMYELNNRIPLSTVRGLS